MYTPSFNGCWAKVERAKEHRDSLDAYIRETFAVEGNRPRVGMKFDRETEEHILYVNYMPDLEAFFTRVSVILGDTVHNLRSGLEHLAFQLALWNTDGNVRNERQVQFPIEDTEEAFNARCALGRGGWLAEVHPDHQAIIERSQPYHGIDQETMMMGLDFHALAMLRDLSNMDKHRLLATVMIPPTSLEFVGHMPLLFLLMGMAQRLFRFESAIEMKPIELGAEISRGKFFQSAVGQETDMAGYIRPEITLPEGRSVLIVLDRIAAVVVKVISEFEALLQSFLPSDHDEITSVQTRR